MNHQPHENEHYLTPEAFHEQRQQAQAHKKVTIPINRIVMVVAAVLLLGIGFASGISYQKGHATKTTSSASQTTPGSTNGSDGFRGGARGGIGSVTAISNTSISISDIRTGSDKTYTISSSTTITDNGAAVTTSDIQVGDTVLITPTSTAGTAAKTILVNPSFGGGQGAPDTNGTSQSGAAGQAPTAQSN